MADIIRKQFTTQVKHSDGLTYEAAITVEVEDRQGQTVVAAGGKFDAYMRNPVVLYAHDYSSLPVARTLELRPETGRIVARFDFPAEGTYPFADTVRRLWGAGFLNTVSIGFIPLKWTEDWKRIEEWELLEYSIVPVPANQEALRLMLDGLQPTMTREGRVLSSKNRELIQAAVTQMNEAIAALRDLLDATEPEKSTEPNDTAQGEPAPTGGEIPDALISKLLDVTNLFMEAQK